MSKSGTSLAELRACCLPRQALALLQARGIEPERVAYLDTPPSLETLRSSLAKLGLPARALLRRGEDAYKTLRLDDERLPEDALIAAMQAYPILIERPIFEHGDKAVIGRPPEKVLEIL